MRAAWRTRDTQAADLETLCGATGGRWDTGGCGDYICGSPSPILCLIPTPGCNCGEGRNFDHSAGCFEDRTCTASGAEAACTGSGGAWDPASCGDYRCGEPPFCDAIIPGCNCGSGRNVDPVTGACVDDRSCGPVDPDETLCTSTRGAWDPVSCGDFRCGINTRSCMALIPGCNCGQGRTFADGVGCSLSAACPACPIP